MKIQRLISTIGVLAIAAVLTAGLPAWANPAAPIRVTVPFAFEAGDRSLPAGAYEIEHRSANGMLIVTEPSGERHALVTFATGDPANPKSPRLVFEKMGSTYRLAEVWVTGAGAGAGVAPTKAQKMLIARAAKRERVEIALVRK